MKKYKASFTVEASVVVSLITFCIAGIIIVGLYTADCQTVRNALIISSIKKQEEYYFYTDDRGFLDEKRKLNEGLFRHFDKDTIDYEKMIKGKLFLTEIEFFEQNREIGNIRSEVFANCKSLPGDSGSAIFDESVPVRNNSDIMRIISILANGGM